VRNTGLQPMPAGIGHHPYFAHRRDGAGTRLRAVVDAIWLADAEILPTALSSADPAVAALRAGMPLAHFDLDNNFTGFAHAARVDWPDGSGLRLLAEPPLDFFVLYCPSKENLFVMEAVSTCADWINLRRHHGAAETGGATLEPGATLQATTRLVPEPTPTQGALHL
jgi:aldose 1-epimerase